jgi:hypothetical protein
MRGFLMAAAMLTVVVALGNMPASAEEGLPNILPEYRTPELRRHALSVGGRTSGGRFYEHWDGTYRLPPEWTSDQREWRVWTRGGISSSWSYTLDRPDLQFKSSFRLGYDWNASQSKDRDLELDGEDRSKTEGENLESTFANSCRKYLDSGLFLGLGISGGLYRRTEDGSYDEGTLYWDYDFGYPIQEDIHRQTESYSQSTGLDASLSAGLGRLHEVTDARQALYILDDLVAQGCLNRKPSRREIIDLAELITQLKNERIFDSREKMSHSLQVIDAWLTENSLLREGGAEYFTLLFDNWLHGASARRFHGAEIELRYTSLRSRWRWINELKESHESGLTTYFRRYDSKEILKGQRADLAVRVSRALSKRLQLDLLAEPSFTFRSDTWDYDGIRFTDDPSETEEYREDYKVEGYEYEILFEGSLKYHRDTRNSFISRLGFSRQRSEVTLGDHAVLNDQEESIDWDRNRFQTEASLSAGWTRYFSMKSRLSTNISYRWSRYRVLTRDNEVSLDFPHYRELDSNFYVSISYSYTVF